MSTSSPFTILTEALSTFSRSANLALTAAESQAREEATRASAEILETRKERDEAIKNSHDLEMEMEGWKAAVAKAELTMSHQTETIAQLRREAQQWQDQCHHLSEISRREIQDWKEQFLRVEKERVRLAERMDELVKVQVMLPQQSPRTPPTYIPHPKSMYPTPHVDATLSLPSNRASTSASGSSSESNIAHNTRGDENMDEQIRGANGSVNGTRRTEIPMPSFKATNGDSIVKQRQRAFVQLPSTSSNANANGRRATTRPQQTRGETHAHPSAQQHSQQPTLMQPRSHVIRRVHTTVEIPIKEEDDEDVPSTASGSVTTSALPAAKVTNVRTNPTKRMGSARSRRIIEDEDEGTDGESVLRDGSDRQGSEDVGGDDSRDGDYRQEDDEQDELMLGSEDQEREIYRVHRIAVPPEVLTPPPPPYRAGTSRKRKVPGTVTNGTGRGGPRRRYG